MSAKRHSETSISSSGGGGYVGRYGGTVSRTKIHSSTVPVDNIWLKTEDENEHHQVLRNQKSLFNNLSQLQTCLDSAHNFLLSKEESKNIFNSQIALIEKHWDTVCDEAELSIIDRNLLWRRQFLNAWSIEFSS